MNGTTFPAITNQVKDECAGRTLEEVRAMILGAEKGLALREFCLAQSSWESGPRHRKGIAEATLRLRDLRNYAERYLGGKKP